jgi:peroxiredoxin
MKRAELYAAIVAIVVAGPLVYVLSRAVADGQVRSREAPVRAMLGAEAFEQLAAGQQTEMHYMGNDRRAPDFTVHDKDGRPWRLSDHRGKVVILNFWSITCRPCVEEMPTLIELATLVRHRSDVEVVALSVDAGWEEVHTLFPRADNPLTVVFDPEREVVRDKFGTRLYPETWFIDPEGIIRLRVDGPRDWSSPLVQNLIDVYR